MLRSMSKKCKLTKAMAKNISSHPDFFFNSLALRRRIAKRVATTDKTVVVINRVGPLV